MSKGVNNDIVWIDWYTHELLSLGIIF